MTKEGLEKEMKRKEKMKEVEGFIRNKKKKEKARKNEKGEEKQKKRNKGGGLTYQNMAVPLRIILLRLNRTLQRRDLTYICNLT